MNKICFWGDCHFSQYSSIVRGRGEQFSIRLEHLIDSLNWVQQLSINNNCVAEVCLGDFFDKSELVSEEITALNAINWNNLTKYFIVGNHEIGRNDLSYSSAHLFNNIPGCFVINKTSSFLYKDILIYFIPYIMENNKKSLEETLKPHRDNLNFNKQLIFSHNDIAGIQLGKFISKSGYSTEEIENNCDLFINGHLHNTSWISNKIFNAGNLVGQNFSEDSFQYGHYAYIIDLDTFVIQKFENPYSFNFYKLDLTNDAGKAQLNNLKQNNIVLSIKVKREDYSTYKQYIDSQENIIERRFIICAEDKSTQDVAASIKSLQLDHLQEFQNFVQGNVGLNDLIEDELRKICE